MPEVFQAGGGRSRVKVFRKIIFIMGLLAIAVLAQNASAVLTEYLPESSAGDGQWQGFKYYDEGQQNDGSFLRGRIDFAVYDQRSIHLTDEEIALTEALDLQGRFIYAYQIFNGQQDNDAAVAYFSIGSLGPVGPSIDYTGSVDDGHEGIEPTSSPSLGVWKFDNRLIYKNEHSWFLILGSNSSPVAGTYEIRGKDQGDPFLGPGGETPEPGMLMLLGLGGAMVLSRRKSNVKQ
ncbi:MAG: PEP-CTERM sorting domain-containing protein [Planctomycetota bacterium]|jgi:hypothetical protein